jgi:hypothetical protein
MVTIKLLYTYPFPVPIHTRIHCYPILTTVWGGGTAMDAVTLREPSLREKGELPTNLGSVAVLRMDGPGSRRAGAIATAPHSVAAAPPPPPVWARVRTGVHNAKSIGKLYTLGSHMRLFWTSSMSRPWLKAWASTHPVYPVSNWVASQFLQASCTWNVTKARPKRRP